MALRCGTGGGALRRFQTGSTSGALPEGLAGTYSTGSSLSSRVMLPIYLRDAGCPADGLHASAAAASLGDVSVCVDDYEDIDLSKPGTRAAPRLDENEGLVTEMRSRLVAGLKRFVAKRLAGLLSIEGLRILDFACDKASEHSGERLGLWRTLEEEVVGGWDTRSASRLLLWTARGYKRLPQWGHMLLGWPFRKFAGLLRRYLGRKMLVACEVAVEYYLSLMKSPQIQFLKNTDDSYSLLDEVEEETDVAFKFIISREIEAPDRF